MHDYATLHYTHIESAVRPSVSRSAVLSRGRSWPRRVGLHEGREGRVRTRHVWKSKRLGRSKVGSSEGRFQSNYICTPVEMKWEWKCYVVKLLLTVLEAICLLENKNFISHS